MDEQETIEVLTDYVINANVDVSIVMHRPDESFPDEEIPENWVLESVEKVAGKRVRIFKVVDNG